MHTPCSHTLRPTPVKFRPPPPLESPERPNNPLTKLTKLTKLKLKLN